MSRPGSVFWLMQHELRLFWRRGKKRALSGLVLAGILLSGWMLISFLIFQRVGPAIPPPPFVNGPGDGFALLIVTVALGFMGSVMTSGAILAAVDAIYTRNDLDLLLSSPVSPWRVLVVRSSAIAIGALPIYAGLLGPPLLWMAIFSSPLWLSSIFVLLTLAFAATGFALLIVTGLFRLIGPRSTRVLAQILSAVAGAAVFLGFQYFNISSRDAGQMSGEQMQEMIGSLNIDPNVWWLFPARAFTGEIVSTVLWIVLVAILFAFGVYIFSRSYVSDAAAASAMGRKKRVSDGRVAQVRGGLMQTVIRKELRLVSRDPLLLSQIGLQMLYLLPLVFLLVRNDSGFTLTEAAFAPALSLLASMLAGSLIWITVSAEDAPDLLASAPVAARAIDRAKLTAAIGPVLALMTIPIVALLVRDIWAGAWAAAGVICAAFAAALIGLWRRNPGSRRDFVRRRAKASTLVGLGQAIVTLGITGAVGLGAYGLPWLAIIPGILAAALLGALYKPTPAFAAAD
jgi:ABC-2 type transport system permease protein